MGSRIRSQEETWFASNVDNERVSPDRPSALSRGPSGHAMAIPFLFLTMTL